MVQDICHAWLHSPSLTMGLGGPASGGFLFTPLLSGDTSVLYKGPFVPFSAFFLFPQHLTLWVCSFFPASYFSVPPPKQNPAERPRLFISPPRRPAPHYDFCISGCAPASLFNGAVKATPASPHPGKNRGPHSPLLFYLQGSGFTTGPLE